MKAARWLDTLENFSWIRDLPVKDNQLDHSVWVHCPAPSMHVQGVFSRDFICIPRDGARCLCWSLWGLFFLSFYFNILCIFFLISSTAGTANLILSSKSIATLAKGSFHYKLKEGSEFIFNHQSWITPTHNFLGTDSLQYSLNGFFGLSLRPTFDIFSRMLIF